MGARKGEKKGARKGRRGRLHEGRVVGYSGGAILQSFRVRLFSSFFFPWGGWGEGFRAVCKSISPISIVNPPAQCLFLCSGSE